MAKKINIEFIIPDGINEDNFARDICSMIDITKWYFCTDKSNITLKAEPVGVDSVLCTVLETE